MPKRTKTLFRPHLRIDLPKQSVMESICEFWRKEKRLEVDPHSNRFWYELLKMSDMAVEHERKELEKARSMLKEHGVLK